MHQCLGGNTASGGGWRKKGGKGYFVSASFLPFTLCDGVRYRAFNPTPHKFEEIDTLLIEGLGIPLRLCHCLGIYRCDGTIKLEKFLAPAITTITISIGWGIPKFHVS